jgi:hypothetical protein
MLLAALSEGGVLTLFRRDEAMSIVDSTLPGRPSAVGLAAFSKHFPACQAVTAAFRLMATFTNAD